MNFYAHLFFAVVFASGVAARLSQSVVCPARSDACMNDVHLATLPRIAAQGMQKDEHSRELSVATLVRDTCVTGSS
jgi:hypothetical protein